ncbi:MAG: hypothetical protein B7733_16880 [Myxococcales bacterium FL481]|nr:MAG: hypothetical protein B7733_16880 [Myxococcales bacterium FL481]
MLRSVRRFWIPLAGAVVLLVGINCMGRSGDERAGPSRYEAHDRTFSVEYVSPPWEVDSQSEDGVRLSIPAQVFGVALDGSPPTHVMIAGLADLASSLEEFLQVGEEDLEDVLGTSVDLTGWTGLPEWTSWTGDIPGLTGDDADSSVLPPGLPEIPDYLQDVNLRNPRDVAYAEMSYLIEQRGARVVSALQTFQTQHGQRGVVFEVALDPGVFVRSFYFRTTKAALRVVFISLFELESGDIDLMAASIQTDGGLGGV